MVMGTSFSLARNEEGFRKAPSTGDGVVKLTHAQRCLYPGLAPGTSAACLGQELRKILPVCQLALSTPIPYTEGKSKKNLQKKSV